MCSKHSLLTKKFPSNKTISNGNNTPEYNTVQENNNVENKIDTDKDYENTIKSPSLAMMR
jgi:hypothetical protein